MSASVSAMSSGTIDRTLARRALALRREGLNVRAIGERLGLTTDQAKHMAAVAARIEEIEAHELTDNELLLISTIARLTIDSAYRGVTRSTESGDVEHRARKYRWLVRRDLPAARLPLALVGERRPRDQGHGLGRARRQRLRLADPSGLGAGPRPPSRSGRSRGGCIMSNEQIGGVWLTGARYEFVEDRGPSSIHFSGPTGPVLTITPEGELQFGEGTGPKEAAEAIADAFKEYVAGLAVRPTFQSRVHPWMLTCFGPAIAADTAERNHRFLEEAIELVQACGGDRREAHQLVDYVFDRPVGEPHQEIGGVMVTLAALCLAHGLDMHEAGETELARVWTKVEQIRAKQTSKPKGSPLPAAAPDQARDGTAMIKPVQAFAASHPGVGIVPETCVATAAQVMHHMGSLYRDGDEISADGWPRAAAAGWRVEPVVIAPGSTDTDPAAARLTEEAEAFLRRRATVEGTPSSETPQDGAPSTTEYLAMLKRVRRREFNSYEPDNQSALWHDLGALIARAEVRP